MQIMESTSFQKPPEGGGSSGVRLEVWAYCVWALLAAGLMVYAETLAYTGDESFHMLAAQLIKAGKRPYLDFCFPQTPLNAYWNAFWMRMFGESWRTVHAVASLETSGAVILASQFVLSAFRSAPGPWPRLL